MRHLLSLAAVGLLCCFVACKDDEPTGPVVALGGPDSGSGPTDGSTSVDAGTSPPADCPGAVGPADPATVDALFSMFGGWQWEKERLNGNEGDYNDQCLKATGYFIGPQVALQATREYARCAVASERPVKVLVGRYPFNGTCVGGGCIEMGMRMISPISGGIYALTPDGNRTTGAPGTYFLPIPAPTSGEIFVMDSRGGSTQTGNRMVRRAGAPGCE